MIYKNLFIFIFFTTIYTQTYPEIGADNSLDIITWNVENFPKSNQTVDYMYDIISDINVDIIALQEIENQQSFDALINQLPNGWHGYRSENTDWGELSYLINTNNVTISHFPYTILDTYNHYFAYRPPYVVKISYNNEEFILINVHYKCCGDGILDNNYWDEEYRRLQASYYLKDYIDNNFSDDNVIVLGDFNDDIAESTNNVFVDFISDHENYSFADMHIAEGPSSDWSFPGWPSHLDHILISDELFDNSNQNFVFTFKIDDYLDGGWSTYDYYISDHRPVNINLSFLMNGDINGDGDINILDVTLLINMILNNQYSDLSDINNDGGLNILDVVLLVNLILH